MNAYKGTFSAATSTGNQAVTGVGFTPKALLVWTTYQMATGYTDGYQYQMGMTDGTRQVSWAVIADDNTSPNDTDRAFSATQLFLIHSVAAATIRAGTIVSLDSDGFTVNWSTVDASAEVFHFVCFGGSDLSAGVSATNTTSLVTDLSSIVPFPWQAWLTMLSVANGDAGNGPTFGFAANGLTGAATQGASCSQVRDGQVTSITGRYQRTAECANIFASATQTIADNFSWASPGPVTITAASVIQFPGMWIGGISAKAGNGLQPTGTGTQAVTGLGFSPKLIFLLTVGQTAQTTVQTEARFSLGASDGTRQGYAWTGATHNVNPSVNAKGHSTTNTIVSATPNATGSSTTTLSEASVQSLDADGFTLNWTTADATQREYLWLAVGNSSAVTSSYAFTFAG